MSHLTAPQATAEAIFRAEMAPVWFNVNLTFAHGLLDADGNPRQPFKVNTYLICVTDARGFVTGDKFEINIAPWQQSYGPKIYSDDTSIYVRVFECAFSNAGNASWWYLSTHAAKFNLVVEAS